MSHRQFFLYVALLVGCADATTTACSGGWKYTLADKGACEGSNEHILDVNECSDAAAGLSLTRAPAVGVPTIQALGDYPKGCYFLPRFPVIQLFHNKNGGSTMPADKCGNNGGPLTVTCQNICRIKCAAPTAEPTSAPDTPAPPVLIPVTQTPDPVVNATSSPSSTPSSTVSPDTIAPDTDIPDTVAPPTHAPTMQPIQHTFPPTVSMKHIPQMVSMENKTATPGGGTVVPVPELNATVPVDDGMPVEGGMDLPQNASGGSTTDIPVFASVLPVVVLVVAFIVIIKIQCRGGDVEDEYAPAPSTLVTNTFTTTINTPPEVTPSHTLVTIDERAGVS